MNRTITVAPVRKTVEVKASQAHAFEVFTQRFDTWWPRSHHIGKSEMRGGVIEPRDGGRWYEIGEDGAECEWGKVLAWEPPARLVLSWHLNGNFKFDPDIYTEVEVTFADAGGGKTRVVLEHRNLERLGEEGGNSLRKGIDAPGGWGSILELFAKAAGPRLAETPRS